MNNKLLTILWTIIIIGSIFIAINIYKPNSKLEKDIEKLTDVDTGENNQKITELKNPENNSKNYKEYIKNGDTFFNSGDYENAIINYKKAVNINGSNSEGLTKLAEAYLRSSQPQEAKKNFTLASQLNPASIKFKIDIARSHLNAREIEETKNLIWKLDEENPNHPLIKYYQAITHILYKNFDQSKEIFEKIVTLDTKPEEKILQNTQKFIDAYKTFSYYPESDKLFLEVLLAKVLTDAEEYETAIPLLFDVLNNKNNYRDAWVILGFAYLNTGKYLDAIDAFTQAKELNPEKPETLFFLGLAYFADDEIDKAIHYIELADKYGFEPKDQINLKLGDLYLLKKEYKKSAQKYENVLAINTEKIEVFTRATWLNIDKLNKPEKGLKIAQKALETHPRNAMSYNLVGWAYTALDDFEKAQKNLNQALTIDPRLDAAYLNFGWLYEKQQKTTLAKEYYQKAYSLGKGNSISNLAAVRYNRLDSLKSQQNYQVNILR